jgi:hypothetical protein
MAMEDRLLWWSITIYAKAIYKQDFDVSFDVDGTSLVTHFISSSLLTHYKIKGKFTIYRHESLAWGYIVVAI